MSAEVELLEAGVAAERLKLSPSGLRRVAAIYETVHGPLPRKSGRTEQRGPRARLYSVEAVERLAAAQSFVAAERYTSIEEGLHAYERGERPDIDAELVGELTPRSRAVQDELTGVLQEAVRRGNEGLEERLTALVEAKFAELHRDLPPPAPATDEPEKEHGPLVKAALWLERWLRSRRL